MRRLSPHRLLSTLSLLLLPVTTISLCGQEVDPQLAVTEEGATVEIIGYGTSYYVLRSSENLEDYGLVDVAFGREGRLSLMERWETIPNRRFYVVDTLSVDDPDDLDGDGMDDVYELTRPRILHALDSTDAAADPDGDGFTNLEEYRNGTDPEAANVANLTTFSSSPSHGANDVAVTRETIIRFTRPLQRAAVPTSVRAEAAGQPIATRLHTSPDRMTLTVFFPHELPHRSLVRLTLNPSQLLDEEGRQPDLDGDGDEGGFGEIEFETLTISTVEGTSVVGRVFASELGDGGMNRPLAGARITVDGRHDLSPVLTDSMGNFRLAPAPAGRFFVHIDGRTARGEIPEGAYYPFVGKAWESKAGRETSIGEVYLPLVQEGTLQPVSMTEETTLTFADAVLAEQPELEGVSITVPPDSLYADDGTRGGMVGIAPVDPDRLPGTLPEDLNLPLVITVQTDGATNFDEPVPVCFPNLPDRETGFPLPPNSKSALWSFNHDTGRFEIVGPMTVSADGKFVCTDPGVGVRAPGWHGTDPGSEGERGNTKRRKRDRDEEEEEEEDDGCEVRPIEVAFQQGGFYIFRVATPGFNGRVEWLAPGAEPPIETGNIYRARFCEPGRHQIAVTLTKPEEDETCASESMTVNVSEADAEPRILTLLSDPDPNQPNLIKALVATNMPGDLRWSVSPREEVITVREDRRAERIDLRPQDGVVGEYHLHFCHPGDYEISVVFTPDHCGDPETGGVQSRSTTVTIAEETVPQMSDVLRAAFLPNQFQTNLSSPVVHTNVPGHILWSVSPSEHVTIQDVDPIRTIPISPNSPVESDDGFAYLSGTDIRFCKAGRYTIEALFVPDECADAAVILESSIVIDFPESLEPRTSEFEGDTELLLLGTNYPGTVTWSVDPPTGLGVFSTSSSTPAAFPFDPSFQYTSTFLSAGCVPGEYAITATYAPEGCTGPPITKSKTFVVTEDMGPRAPNGISFGDLGDSGVFSIEFSHAGTTEWSFSPADAVEVLFDSGTTQFQGNDRDLPWIASAGVRYCRGGSITASVYYEPEVCSEVPGSGFTSSITVIIPENVDGCDGLPQQLQEGPPRILQQTEATETATGRFHYLLVNQSNQRETRGVAGSRGLAHPNGLRMAPNTAYEEILLDADTLEVARATWTSPGAGQRFELPEFLFEPVPDETDADMDGLHDLAERILGTDPGNSDSDGDGRPDGPEVLSNTDPLDGVPAKTGIVANLELPGETLDICTTGDFALTANGSEGLCIVNIFNGLEPVLVGRVDTLGFARQVACDSGYAAVADGDGGLAIIQLAEPANESRLLYQVPFGTTVTAVEAANGLAFAGLQTGEVVAVDLTTGVPIADLTLSGGEVMDITIGGTRLLAATPSDLGIMTIPGTTSFQLLGELKHRGRPGAGNRPFHLSAGTDSLFLTHSSNYATFTFDGISLPQPVANTATAQFGWKQLIPDGNGLAVAAVGTNSTDDGPHHVSIYDVSDLENNDDFVTEIRTPGLASGLDLANGRAYVADSLAGLQVINYLTPDFGDIPPDIALTHNFTEGEAEEHALLLLTARCTDDVQVRQVEFFLNDERLGADGKFPYEWRLRVPSKERVPQLKITARVSDTAGNSAEADLLLTVVDDASAPTVLWATPIPGGEVGADTATVISVKFSEPLDTTNLDLNGALALVSAGADAVLETGDDEVIGGSARYLPGLQTLNFAPERLPGGLYQATLGSGLVDRTGNASAPFTWSFSVPGPQIVSHFPSGGQQPYRITQIRATADRALLRSSLNQDDFRLVRLENGNEVTVIGTALASLEDAATVVLETDEPLIPGTYEAVVEGLQDALESHVPPYSWTFTIRGARPTAFTPGLNVIAPSGLTEASVRFDTPLDASTINALTLRQGDADGDVTPVSAIGYDTQENRVRMTFTEPLTGGDYFWHFGPGLLDFAGNAVESVPNQKFTIDANPTMVRGRLVTTGGTALPGVRVRVAYEDALGRERVELATSAGDGSFGTTITALRVVIVSARLEGLLDEPIAVRPVSMAPVEEGITDFGTLTMRPVFDGVLDAGYGHVLWINAERQLQSFGQDAQGQLGLGQIGGQQFQPLFVDDPNKAWATVSAGHTHSAAIDTEGLLWTWGGNERGQLLDGNFVNSGVPVSVLTGQRWRDVGCGTYYTVAIRDDGTLWSWGHAPHGKVSGELREPVVAPQQVGSESSWTQVSAGSGHVLALQADGSLWAWGANGDGQLGDGTRDDQAMPVRIGTTNDWQRIAAGHSHSMAIKADGSLWGWGLNNSNKVGFFDEPIILEPRQVDDSNDWTDIAIAANHSLARKVDSSVWFWGNDNEADAPGVNAFSALGGPQQVSWERAVLVATSAGMNIAVRDSGNPLTSGFHRVPTHFLSHSTPAASLGTPSSSYGAGVTEVRLNFFSDIDPDTVTSDSVTLRGRFNLAPAISFASGTSQIILHVNTPLEPQVVHVLRISEEVADVTGQPYAGTNSLQFQINPPQLTDAFPTMEAGARIPFPNVDRLEFSSQSGFDATTITQETILLADVGPDGRAHTEDDIPVNGEVIVNADADHVRYELADPLPLGQYTATLHPGVRNQHGHDFRFVSSFSGPIPVRWNFAVTAGPEVFRTNPEAQYFFSPFDPVSGLAAYQIVFSHTEMNAQTIHAGSIQMREGDANGTVIAPASLIYDPSERTATLTFAPPLPEGTYTISLSDTIEDARGRALEATNLPLEIRGNLIEG